MVAAEGFEPRLIDYVPLQVLRCSTLFSFLLFNPSKKLPDYQAGLTLHVLVGYV